jgi:hypothetical protein
MKRLQHWFDIVAGIAHDEQLRREQARAIFANKGPNVDALQTPACWRRRARIYAA